MWRHNFIFSIADLKKEVEKRTSYLGKMRGTDEQPHLLERLSLTDGESFLSDEFIRDAAAETYEWIKAFGKHVPNACWVYPSGPLKSVVANEGVTMVCNEKRWRNLVVELKPENVQITENISYFAYLPDVSEEKEEIVRYPDIDEEGTWWGWKTVTSNIQLFAAVETLVDGTALYSTVSMTQVGTVELGESGYAFNITGDFAEVSVDTGIAASVKADVEVRWRSAIEGAPIEDEHVTKVHLTETADFTVDDFDVDVELFRDTQALGAPYIKAVDSVTVRVVEITPAQSIIINEGDYVKYTDDDGNEMYGFVVKDGLPLKVVAWFDKDVREAIVFTVMLPMWSDKNMLPSAERYLKEALVNYVIWKWMEIVYPKEAETYEEKFEDKGHQAQLALNTENRTLQRDTLWLH